MQQPAPSTPEENAIRLLAGNCYLALRTGDGRHLLLAPDMQALERSGLASMHANLCIRFGMQASRDAVIQGMQVSTTNKLRWKALHDLLAQLEPEGIQPVLFKGGALHARWPEMRELRKMFDYDLIVPQSQVTRLRAILSRLGYESPEMGSWLTQRLSKGWMVWKGNGLGYQNLDIHARVSEPPVCSSLTRSILASRDRADGVRIPDIEDCICMIALHIVRSGMYRPLREYIDLLWYVDEMDDTQWQSVCTRARQHHLVPALFLALRQAVFCLALEELAPERAKALNTRIDTLGHGMGSLRMRALNWLAPPDYPLHPIEARNRPTFRRSFILGAGTGSAWRVAGGFLIYGLSRLGDRLTNEPQGVAAD